MNGKYDCDHEPGRIQGVLRSPKVIPSEDEVEFACAHIESSETEISDGH